MAQILGFVKQMRKPPAPATPAPAEPTDVDEVVRDGAVIAREPKGES